MSDMLIVASVMIVAVLAFGAAMYIADVFDRNDESRDKRYDK